MNDIKKLAEEVLEAEKRIQTIHDYKFWENNNDYKFAANAAPVLARKLLEMQEQVRVLREACKKGVLALERGLPQIKGVLVIQDYKFAIEQINTTLAATAPTEKKDS